MTVRRQAPLARDAAARALPGPQAGAAAQAAAARFRRAASGGCLIVPPMAGRPGA